MTPDEAEALAAQALAAIGTCYHTHEGAFANRCNEAADRERVTSDLAGLRDHERGVGILTDECNRCYQMSDPCDDATRYADNLRRTAALYGVTS